MSGTARKITERPDCLFGYQFHDRKPRRVQSVGLPRLGCRKRLGQTPGLPPLQISIRYLSERSVCTPILATQGQARHFAAVPSDPSQMGVRRRYYAREHPLRAILCGVENVIWWRHDNRTPCRNSGRFQRMHTDSSRKLALGASGIHKLGTKMSFHCALK